MPLFIKWKFIHPMESPANQYKLIFGFFFEFYFKRILIKRSFHDKACPVALKSKISHCLFHNIGGIYKSTISFYI